VFAWRASKPPTRGSFSPPRKEPLVFRLKPGDRLLVLAMLVYAREAHAEPGKAQTRENCSVLNGHERAHRERAAVGTKIALRPLIHPH
jgi:hypothetical protein